jgi:lipid-binding SYLF domain-containing protein
MAQLEVLAMGYTMIRRTLAMVVAAAGLAVLAPLQGCKTEPKGEAGKAEMSTDVDAALKKAKIHDPSLEGFLNKSYGYAVFPTVGKGGLVVGGAYGKGEAFEQGKRVAYCDITQATIGAQAGGQAYTEIIAFENKAAYDSFRYGKLKFAAQATAVALKSGAAANAKYTDGVSVMTTGESGLMAEASVGGQSFSYKPIE